MYLLDAYYVQALPGDIVVSKATMFHVLTGFRSSGEHKFFEKHMNANCDKQLEEKR